MFIIVIIIIIKSTRLDSIDYKSAQRGVDTGGGRGNTLWQSRSSVTNG